MDNRKRAVLYARCSSEQQAEKGLSVPAQLEALRKYAGDKGIGVVGEFVDEGASGKSMRGREALMDILSQAKQKPRLFDLVLVWKFDRFGRNADESMLNKAVLKKNGVRVKSITQDFPDDAMGALAERFAEVMDAYFSQNLAENVFRGLKHMASQGFRVAKAPLGYVIVQVEVAGVLRPKLEIDSTHAPVIKQLFDMASSGLGTNQIANLLNAEGLKTKTGSRWTRSCLLHILKNEAYVGNTTWLRRRKVDGIRVKSEAAEVIRVEGTHPALVSREQFARVQQHLASRNFKFNHPRTHSSSYLLTGFLHCACGRHMFGSSAKNCQYGYYVCGGKTQKATDCQARKMRKRELEEFIIDRVAGVLLDSENIAQLVELTNTELLDTEYSDQLAAVEAQLKSARAQLEKLFDAIQAGAIELSDVAPRVKTLKAEIKELEARYYGMSGIAATRPDPISEGEVQAYVEGLRHTLTLLEPAQQKSVMRSFIKRIEVNLPSVKIEYTLPLPTSGQLGGTCVEQYDHRSRTLQHGPGGALPLPALERAIHSRGPRPDSAAHE